MLGIPPALPVGVDILSRSGGEGHVAGFLGGLCGLLLSPLVDRIDAAIDDAAACLRDHLPGPAKRHGRPGAEPHLPRTALDHVAKGPAPPGRHLEPQAVAEAVPPWCESGDRGFQIRLPLCQLGDQPRTR